MTNFFGAQCSSYPDCTGGCGLGCTHDHEPPRKKAVAYMRTSSSTNVGEDKDSQKRQRAAIEAFAQVAGYEIADTDWYYDPAVKGADAIETREGFAAMLARIEGNGVRTIIVETANRFARDLMVQEVGFDMLKKQGITLIAADSPQAFVDDTPTATLIRQILGAVAQFEKASLVAKLKGARARKAKETGTKCGGRKSYAEINAEMVTLAKACDKQNMSLRQIAQVLFDAGFKTATGNVFSPSSIKSMVEGDNAD